MILATLSTALLLANLAEAERFDELHLDVSIGAELGLERVEVQDPQRIGRWKGEWSGSSIEIDLIRLPADEWGFREAGGVTDAVVGWLRRVADFDIESTRFFEGEYGSAPILAVSTAPTGEAAAQYVLGGLTDAWGYAFHVHCDPRPAEKDEQALIEAFEEGLAYDGPERDPEWTYEEIEARWRRDAPDDLHEDFALQLTKPGWRKKAVVRTKHYVIMTNASGGKLFAKQMEKNYKEIVKVFPFPEVEGRRLMPVFLFRTKGQYQQFLQKTLGMSPEDAARTGGIASRDFYSTWYEAPGDPVHIHEQTHQIFKQRLFVNGGGSWFQEGVAEYMETTENERNVVANTIKKGRHMPLPEFVTVPSLALSSNPDRVTGGSEAGDLYKQAALFVEFLRESKWGKDKFEEYLYTVGRVPRGDLEKVRAAFLEVYGATLEEIDQEFQEYCEKR